MLILAQRLPQNNDSPWARGCAKMPNMRVSSLPGLRTIAAYSSANLGVNMVNAFSNAALPLYLASYSLPAWLVGVLAQQDSSLGGIEQPFIGLLSDRTRTRLGKRRPFFLVGVPLVVLSLAFLSTHPPFWAVVLNLTLFASFLAVANDPYKALMADLFASEQRGRVGAAAGLANMAGQVVFLLLANFLWETNEPWVFHLVELGLVGSFAITFLGIREPETTTAPASWHWQEFRRYLRDVLSHREFSKYAIAQLFYWFGVGGAVPFLTRFGVVVLGVSEATAFLLFMVLVLSTFLFTVPAGLAGDRWGKKRVLSFGLAAFALIAVVGSRAQDATQGVAVMALVGVANAVTTTLSFPLFTDLMPSGRIAEFTGFSALVSSLAEAVGAGAVGAFVDLTDNFRAVFIVTGILIAISFLLLQRVHPERAALD